jgi:phytoene desaturase
MQHNKNKSVVIGAGFAGLSAAASLAKNGFSVTVLEKNDQVGGRARVMKENGFVFDMGPSWYWMPDVMERFFNSFGKSASDYFQLVRLDPSYQVIFGKDDVMKIPASFEQLKELFESQEKGSAKKLEKFLAEAEFKYKTGMQDFVYKPSVSVSEFFDWRILSSLFRLDLLSSFSSHAKKYFKNERLLQLLEFPVLFLGAKPADTPALYSMMNYADMKLGTWYPMGGMYKLVEAMEQLAKQNGVEFRLSEPVVKISTCKNKIEKVITTKSELQADNIVAGADYHHVENNLIENKYRSYTESYWNKKTFAPSCIIYYLGVNKKLPRLLHHNLFFDESFENHAASIYENKSWPNKPLFYACVPSVTDESVAPKGMENIFILIPVAAGLEDTEEIRKMYFELILKRLETFCGEKISSHIVLKKSYAASNFISDYNAYKGNAYGLAGTLMQTAFLRPSIQSKKIKNLFYTGQLTVPGPGVPPSIISGQVVADYVTKKIMS